MFSPELASGQHTFDLNIDKVLEHWTVPFALRELIANALDEQAITGTSEPQIFCDADGDWHIRDFGRGLQYQHLSQNESAEKLRSDAVIGQFPRIAVTGSTAQDRQPRSAPAAAIVGRHLSNH